MKKLLTTAAWLTTLAATSQVVYTDIPDASTTLTAPGVSEFVAIDFNNDGTQEYNFRWDLFGDYWFLHITFEGDNEINLKTGATMGLAYAEPMEANQVIGTSANWGNSFPEPFIGDYEDANFKGLGERYIGVKFTLNGAAYYGWILVSLDDNFGFTVKSYAYESTPDTAIAAGATGIAALNDTAADFISIYPNPAGSSIAIKSINGQNIKHITVNDLTGKQVATTAVNSSTLQQTVDISNLQPGVYVLNAIGNNNKATTKKFIKI